MTENQKVITDVVTANFLTNPETRHLLAPFMAQETPMAEAAKALGVELNTLHRRVGQMLELGLLELTREEVRRGHRVKLYRATRREFIVPLEATSSTNLESHVAKTFEGIATILSQGVARAMEREHLQWGFKIYIEEGYGLTQRVIPVSTDERVERRENKTVWYGDTYLQLSDKEAKTFRHELQTLYDKYRFTPHSETRKGHYFFAALTPC